MENAYNIMRIASYIKFLWKSTNAHGVHSPFVFWFINRYFYSGSPKLNHTFYKGSANNVSYTFASTLYRIIHDLKPPIALLDGDNRKAIQSIISEASKHNDKQNIIVSLNPDTELPDYSKDAPTLYFIYISHKHKAATQNRFEQLLPSITDNTILIINHIHFSPEMEEAWTTIKNHPKVTVTIDTFFQGFVFFREVQQKEHFIIRPFTSLSLDTILGARKLWGLLH
jgi:hypothetical protein